MQNMELKSSYIIPRLSIWGYQYLDLRFKKIYPPWFHISNCIGWHPWKFSLPVPTSTNTWCRSKQVHLQFHLCQEPSPRSQASPKLSACDASLTWPSPLSWNFIGALNSCKLHLSFCIHHKPSTTIKSLLQGLRFVTSVFRALLKPWSSSTTLYSSQSVFYDSILCGQLP